MNSLETGNNIVYVENLVKTYHNGVKALDGISFSINKGDVCGYLGANGAGKSTTIKILSGMITADSGIVAINGNSILTDAQNVKKMIGYVPESGALFLSLTPYDFLEFTCKMYDMSRRTSLQRINEFMELFDLKNELRTPMANFSKGMRQKVLIIASIIHNPDIIFWDEPLSGIDYNTTLLIQNLVRDLSEKGKTFFYSSHVIDNVEKICNRVLILNAGKIVLDKVLSSANGSETLDEIFKKYIDPDAAKEKSSIISRNLTE